MKYGICNLSIIPVRSEASDKSELVTQLLFGDIYEVIEEAEKWLKIKIQYDNYEGWMDKIQFLSVNEYYFKKYVDGQHSVLTKYSALIHKENMFFPVLLGSVLPFYDGETIIINNENFTVNAESKAYLGVKETAYLYINAPYLWGGKTPYGIDCSGFTQQVYKMNGIKIYRDASQQVTQGDNVDFEKQKEGDLAFFENKNGNITHVGILLADNKIIHAHGKVRIDILDKKGIYNMDREEYSHTLHSIRTYKA